MPDLPAEFTLKELRDCVAREVAMRKSCYPRWDKKPLAELSPGRQKEIAMMEMIGQQLDAVRDMSPQAYTFDSPKEGTRVLVYLEVPGGPHIATRTGLNDWDFEHTIFGTEDTELSAHVIAFSYIPESLF